jgi:class 3 adenylate cyclase
MGDHGDARQRDHRELDRLLGEMALRPDLHEDYCDEIDRLFGEDGAVMVLDMSGFTRKTQSCGIVEGLLMTYRMRALAAPLIAGEQGRIVKSEADNLYCLFPTVAEAITASLAIARGMERANATFPGDEQLYASIGVGYGRILNIGGADYYGDEVNRTSKLAEDIAGRGDILLTPRARAMADEAGLETQPAVCDVSGLSITHHRALPKAWAAAG